MKDLLAQRPTGRPFCPKHKNFPYSLADARKTVEGCRVSSEVKPNFCKPPLAQLIEATQPLERLSVDFKGPLPSSTKNRYLLTIVDEYSRFPFAFPCASVDSKAASHRIRFTYQTVNG